MNDSIKQVCEKHNINMRDTNSYYGSQFSKQILDRVAELCGFEEEKRIYVGDKYGGILG